MEVIIILFSCLILIVLILNWFLYKKLAFRIITSFILICLGTISVFLSDRYFQKQTLTYHGKKITLDELKTDLDFSIYEINTFSIAKADIENNPNRIRILKLFSNQCNRNDSIVEIKGRGKIMASTYWFLKKEGEFDAKGFLLY